MTPKISVVYTCHLDLSTKVLEPPPLMTADQKGSWIASSSSEKHIDLNRLQLHLKVCISKMTITSFMCANFFKELLTQQKKWFMTGLKKKAQFWKMNQFSILPVLHLFANLLYHHPLSSNFYIQKLHLGILQQGFADRLVRKICIHHESIILRSQQFYAVSWNYWI